MTIGSSIPANTNQVKNLLSTSVISGCAVTTFNTTATTFDITVGRGLLRFVDNFTDATLPNFKGDKVFPETTLTDVDITVAHLISIDENLVLTLPTFTGLDDAEQRRDRIQLGTTRSVLGTHLPTLSMIGFDVTALLRDHGEAYGPVRMSGLKLLPDSTNLQFKRTAGNEFTPSYFSYFTNTKNPTNNVLTEQSPVTFFNAWQDTPGNFVINTGQTAITPGVFDDGASASSTGPDGVVNNNEAQILRIYEVFGAFGLLYGQQTYISISAAVDALINEKFLQFFGFIGTSFRGFIVIRGGATNLSLSTDAIFFDPLSDLVGVRAS